MPRKKKSEDQGDFFAELSKETGGQILSQVSETKFFIDTGNLALNYICSGKFVEGGIPGNKITEVYGPPSSAKSLLGMCVLHGCQKMGGIAIYLDCERAANADFAKKAGHVDVDRLVVYEPASIEDVENKVKAATKKIREKMGDDVPILFVLDSISVLGTEREWNQVDLPENATQAAIKAAGGKEKPGERAKSAGDMLRRMNPFLDNNQASMFIINQTRQAIGVMFGSDEITAGGGKALPFYASLRLRTSATKHFTDELEVPCGVKLNFRNKKNRSFKPFLTALDVQLFFDKGINPLGGMLAVLKGAGRIEGKGTYTVKEPWANGEKITFKTKAADNLIPSEVLFKCPALIDAKDEDQVRDYLQSYAEAIEVVESGKLKESDITDEIAALEMGSDG